MTKRWLSHSFPPGSCKLRQSICLRMQHEILIPLCPATRRKRSRPSTRIASISRSGFRTDTAMRIASRRLPMTFSCPPQLAVASFRSAFRQEETSIGANDSNLPPSTTLPPKTGPSAGWMPKKPKPPAKVPAPRAADACWARTVPQRPAAPCEWLQEPHGGRATASPPSLSTPQRVIQQPPVPALLEPALAAASGGQDALKTPALPRSAPFTQASPARPRRACAPPPAPIPTSRHPLRRGASCAEPRGACQTPERPAAVLWTPRDVQALNEARQAPTLTPPLAPPAGRSRCWGRRTRQSLYTV